METVTRAFAVLAALAITACASAPVALVALPSPPASQGTTPSAGTSVAGATVLVREVSLPAYLDSFPVVLTRTGSALVVSRDTEWAERPSTGATRVLRDALARLADVLAATPTECRPFADDLARRSR